MADGLDLDALDSEAAPIPPYEFTLAGKTYTAIGPDDIDWHIAEELDPTDSPQILCALLGDDQWAEFTQHNLKARTLNKLIEAIDKHFASSVGEGDASPQS